MRAGRGPLAATALAAVAVLTFLSAKMLPARPAHAQAPKSRQAGPPLTNKRTPADPVTAVSDPCCHAKACSSECSCSCSHTANASASPTRRSPRDGSLERRSELDEPATLLSLLPHGSKVQKGQAAGELDSKKLRDGLAAAKFKVLENEAALRKATLDRESAVLKLKEYDSLEEIDRMKLRSEVTIAKAARDRARLSLETVQKVDKKYKMKGSGPFQDQLDRTETEVDLAQNRLDIHVKYTSVRERKEIESELERSQGG